ncbi:hypothetical protein FQN57_005359 [Myotisia sp. PD_48]|nr:hypothetical protein FQN57_005359 [Myotisia sp. PD_48]
MAHPSNTPDSPNLLLTGLDPAAGNYKYTKTPKPDFEDAASKMLSLYDAGVPFFTKQAIREFNEHIQSNSNNDQVITVKTLDGNTYDLTVSDVGRVEEEYDDDDNIVPDMEGIQSKPRLKYCSLQELCSSWEFKTHPLSVLSPMGFKYLIGMRRKDTGEIFPYINCSLQPLDQVQDSFTTIREQWEASNECKTLKSILLSANISPNIYKIVAFALASISYDEPDEKNPHTLRSFYQHAMVLTVREALLQKIQIGRPTNDNPYDIECYAQDPAYSRHDKIVLDEAGIKVIPDPEGFLEADESSVVISIAPNIAVKQVLADIVKPAVIIWDQVDLNEKIDLRVKYTDPTSPRVIRMIRDSYDEIAFPGDLDPFNGIAIYVRRPALAN